MKGGRYALLKNPANLTPFQREQLKDITSRNATLAEVYRMKETFRDLYRQPDIVAATVIAALGPRNGIAGLPPALPA